MIGLHAILSHWQLLYVETAIMFYFVNTTACSLLYIIGETLLSYEVTFTSSVTIYVYSGDL